LCEHVFVQEQIVELLAQGLSKREIADVLGVSASTVSRHALRRGHRSRAMGATRFDWAEIRRFYDAGATVRECQARFGFSNGAWDSAAARGDVVPRRDPRPKLAHRRRRNVEALLRRGMSMKAAAAELGISPSTVSYHARHLGIPVMESARLRYNWEEIQLAYDSGISVGECQSAFGFSRASWQAAVRRGAVVPRPAAMPIHALLAGVRSRNHLKLRLFSAGLKRARCEQCGLVEWQGEALSLALHHVNGDPNDYRLENLQILCPNCHSQTENFAGRNRRRRDVAGPAGRNGAAA
jgi:DNA-binding CsgD family transcriptional regulator